MSKLNEAAKTYSKYDSTQPITGFNVSSHYLHEGFKAGAAWQAEQDKAEIEELKKRNSILAEGSKQLLNSKSDVYAHLLKQNEELKTALVNLIGHTEAHLQFPHKDNVDLLQAIDYAKDITRESK